YIYISGYNKNFLNNNKFGYISLAPSITEIIYAINAQDDLIAVTSWCDYPKDVQKKFKMGDSFSINKEAIIKLKPAIILALDSQKPLIDDLKLLKVKVYYFSSNSIEDIYKNITKIGQVTEHAQEANQLLTKLKQKQTSIKKPDYKKNILYIAHANPIISIGKKSFITDIIRKAGHESITDYLKTGYDEGYPEISLEFAMLKKPDIVVVCDKNSADYLSKFLKNSKFMILTREQCNIVNRPGPRAIDAIKIFASL
ncbi:MAG: helical backbone metal receptor, partial [bacterium]